MVYVLNKDNKPLMPTNRYAKVRILLKNKMAKVINNKPFTIKLLYDVGNYTQPISLGIDSGYLNIGFSAISNNRELISGEVKLLQGMSERLKEKRMYRTQRRSRLRYRKPRFNNRTSTKKEGWLAPSIKHKLDSHIRFIEYLRSILPISTINVEVANFDIQKIKNPSIGGEDYQNGEKKDFFNLREYILHRDGHKCQNPNCKNKDKEPILQTHHICYYNGDRTNRPSNLITLCNKCHIPKNHLPKGFLYKWSPKLKSFKDATFMTSVRWRLIAYLKDLDIKTNITYGSITKSNRIAIGLDKTHYNDAFVIAGGTIQRKAKPIRYNQIRRNNRSLEKFYDKKVYDIRDKKVKSGQDLFNGRRTRSNNKNTFNLRVYRGQTKSKGKRTIRKQRYDYQPKDIVIWQDRKYISKGTHNKGSRIMLIIPNEEKPKSVSVKEIIPYRYSKGFVVME